MRVFDVGALKDLGRVRWPKFLECRLVRASIAEEDEASWRALNSLELLSLGCLRGPLAVVNAFTGDQVLLKMVNYVE